ncbi:MULTISPECIES: DUF937 domain-containing protein [Rhizobium/Agrobacterium group]|uniref:DUF937 domain-containing protein n=2 Tax=Rhizobium/Agrobacterium group TaxID=227290 RepID=B9K1U7_ALLAM|nr:MULTISPECIES: DUF937 domain-containing protein [Rhizobium/Agrobacterium group]ACM38845.1 conserved hypothetical protein [Allorhizobium ampelinum S4]MCF1446012.1 DUF937 domain-containing protein [Allorhizobium ampelinum]MCF1490996.1 DUF937 domain-containing protein [Allorhizobium ampelinum]MUO26456.1 DUF937 domain-containing protein [Agrobacterium vitis]MUO41569.1 DUF937 domain-containing protein [Agrobacterium vitis]
MLPLFDMLLRAQNGAAMDAMAKQFGLAQEQVAQALAALTPAFSSGFKRTAANPYDLSSLFTALSSGNYAQYFEDMGKAFTPQGIADGNQVLQQLFGSKEVSRAVAAQAAQITGIGQDILKRMLPAMADTIMGGLFKQSLGQMQQASNPFANNPMAGPMAGMIQEWLQATGFSPKAQPTSPGPFDNPFIAAWQQMMGISAAKAAPKTETNPFLDNPFTKAWQDMVSGSMGQAAKAEPPKPSPEAEARKSMMDIVNTMFDSGLNVQKSYQKSVEQIFETYVTAPGKDARAESDEGATHSKH